MLRICRLVVKTSFGPTSARPASFTPSNSFALAKNFSYVRWAAMDIAEFESDRKGNSNPRSSVKRPAVYAAEIPAMSATPLRTRSRCAGGAPSAAMISILTLPWVASSTCFAHTLTTPSLTGCVGGSQLEYLHTVWAEAACGPSSSARLSNSAPRRAIVDILFLPLFHHRW